MDNVWVADSEFLEVFNELLSGSAEEASVLSAHHGFQLGLCSLSNEGGSLGEHIYSSS